MGVTDEREAKQPIGDMTLAGLQEALRPTIREVVAEVITGVREEGFLTRYDRPTEVLISTMAVRIDAMEDDIVEIKARLGRLEDSLEIHRRDDIEESRALRREMAEGFTALREALDAHCQENAAEFKAVRQEMAAEFKAVRQEMAAEFKAVRQEMAAEFKAVRQEMAAEFKAVRQEITELREMMRRQLMWTVATMLTVGGLVIAVVTILMR